MGEEIELISDGDGLVVVGDRSAVERFLDGAGLLPEDAPFPLGRLSGALRIGAELAATASEIAEKSAFYLKLTPESVVRIQGRRVDEDQEGGSHPRHARGPRRGRRVASGRGRPGRAPEEPHGCVRTRRTMSQVAQQVEANELKTLLVQMDEKLDDVRSPAQRDAVLAKLQGAAATIEDAIILRERDGDPQTLWSSHVDMIDSATSKRPHRVPNALSACLSRPLRLES